MPERIKITVRPSPAHPDVLTVEDAMRQVLDVFEMLESVPGVQWKLVYASTNSPLVVEGEAVSYEPTVDVSVVARAQKQKLARNLRQLAVGGAPIDPDFKVATAKRVLHRNLNGVGATDIDLAYGDAISVTQAVARTAVEVLEHRPDSLFDRAVARDEIGSVEGTLSDVGTHYNAPAAKIIDTRGREIWCRLSEDLQKEFQNKATYQDVWQHRRVIARGRLKYGKDGELLYVLANDIRRIETRSVSVEEIRDPTFTGGLSVAEYLDRFRDGTLG